MPIEQISPELERIVSVDTEIEELGNGYGGDPGPTEGPLWWKEGGYLLFSDIFNDRRMKWTPSEGVSLHQQGTNRANGLTRDLEGRLLACEHGARRVSRLEPDGTITVVADNYRGKPFNSPNDVVVKSDGSIYFTDPPFGLPDQSQGKELDFQGVFRVSPDGELTLLLDDMERPNGLAFSPDESILYINDSHRRHIRAFEVDPNGTLDLATDRVFCDLNGDRPGVPDGMKVDIEGNVYCGGSGGLWIIDSSGKHLGIIVPSVIMLTNVAWGGEDWKTLFVTTRHTLRRIQLRIPGIPVPSGT